MNANFLQARAQATGTAIHGTTKRAALVDSALVSEARPERTPKSLRKVQSCHVDACAYAWL